MLLRNLVLAIIVLFQTACQYEPPSIEHRREKIKSMETSATPSAMERKARSDARLAAEGVPVNNHLPAIEDASEVRRRTSEEVAWRAMALLVVAAKGEGLEQPIVDEVVAEYALEPHFTPNERAFIGNASPTDHERIQFVWRYEAAWTLLWALGYVESLGKPTAVCDVPRAVAFLRERSSATFISDAKLRSLDSLLDEADLIYRYHWAVVDARVNGKENPASLDSGVTMERHYALNWLIGYMDEEWDDISTDT